MQRLKIALFNVAVVVLALLYCVPAFAAGIRVLPSTTSVLPGSDFYFDVVAEGIPADGLSGVQFRLNVTNPSGTVAGVTDLSQASPTTISVASPLLISPPTQTRSGIGDFFWNGQGPNGILVIDNQQLTNGTALFTYSHTDGATPPTGSGSVARFMVRVGSGALPGPITINLTDVLLMDGGPAYPLDYNTPATVTVQCTTTVPSLLGLDLNQAQAALAAANLSLGTVSETANPNGTLPLNVVLSQSITGGTTALCQTPVDLAINTPPLLTLDQPKSPTTLAAQTLTGSMAPGGTVTVSANGTVSVGAVTYPASGTWSCPIGNLAAGANSITINSTDSYGNRSSVTAVIEYLPLSVAVTPPQIAAGFQGTVALGIGNLPSQGAALLVEQYVDLNGNGVIDAEDYLVRSFTVTDGVGSSNLNIQGDEDASADGSVTTTLNYFLPSDLYHAPGRYLFRVTSGDYVAVTQFTVAPTSGTQVVSGTVTDGTSPIPGATVRLLDKWRRPLAFSIADETGAYTLNILQAGTYYLAPAAYGYATPAASVRSVTVTGGQDAPGNDLALSPGTSHCTGRVKDSDGSGISGVWVKATGPAFSAVAMTDGNGGYDLLLPAGSYRIAASADAAEPNPFTKGYAAFANQGIDVNLSGDLAGQDMVLPKGTLTVHGKVVDQAGQPVPGLPVQGRIWSSDDPREPVSLGITDASGNYAVTVFDSDRWNLLLGEEAQVAGYVGTIIRDFSTGTANPDGNDLTAYPVTAWVEGTVKDSTGKLLDQVPVRLRNGASSQVAGVRTAADGTYRLGAYAGDWMVKAVTEAAGLYPVPERTASLTDGQTVNVDFTADVSLPAVSPAVLPNGSANTLYQQTLTATGAIGPYTFNVVSGALPDGITLDPVSGVMTGTPTVADVSSSFSVRVTDANGLWIDQSYTVTIFGAPFVLVTSPADGLVTNDNKPLLKYTASAGSVLVKVDGQVQNKVDGQTLDPLPDGVHVLDVETTNGAGVTASAKATFTVDTVAPVVTINSPAAGATKNRTPLLAFTLSEGAAVVKIDGVAANKTSGQQLDPLSDGAHTIQITATDAAGNVGSASVTFTVDTIPPAITIGSVVSPTAAVSQDLTGTVEAGAVVTLSANTSALTGPVSYPTSGSWSCSVANLVPGNNNFTVTATDAAGNVSNAFVTIAYRSPLSATVSPATIQASYQGKVTLSIGNLATTGTQVLVEQFVDANRNGVLDAGDYVVRSFKVSDGISSANPNVQGDEDGAGNSAVTTSLDYFLLNDLFHAPGRYIFRVTNGSDVAAVPFTVEATATPQSISGTVSAGGTSKPGAIVQLTDKWRRPVSYALADATGSYTLNVKDAGNYVVVPVSFDAPTGTTAATVNLASGQNLTGQNLALGGGSFLVTGQVKDASTGTGIGGIWVRATSTDTVGNALTATDGSYSMTLPAGQYHVAAAADPTVANPSGKGYLTFAKQSVAVDVSADVSVADIDLPQAGIVISGETVAGDGTAAAGIPVQAKIPATFDPREPVGYGITRADGSYSIALTSGTNWSISLHDATAQGLRYIGSAIPVFSTATGAATGNNMTVAPITAWIQGTVTNSNNTFVVDADMQVRGADSPFVATAGTAADGTYLVGALSGNWLIDDVTHNKAGQTLEQAVTLSTGMTATADFVVDVTPPDLKIDPLASPTTSTTVLVTGTVETGATVAVNVDTAASVGTVSYPTATTWSCQLSGLVVGGSGNTITVTATDAAGNSTTATANVVVATANYTISATAGSNGTITPAGNTVVAMGESVTCTITPNNGYRILDVAVDGLSQGAITGYSFLNVTASHTIQATFAVNTYTITATAGTGGTISPSGATTVNYGNSVTFTITPNPAYVISGVVVDGTPVALAGSHTFTNIASDHTISASFTLSSSATLSQSWSVYPPAGGYGGAPDKAGNFYGPEYQDGFIYRLNSSGVVDWISTTTATGGMGSVVTDASGNVYGLNGYGNVFRFAPPSTAAVWTKKLPQPPPTPGYVSVMAVDNKGYLYCCFKKGSYPDYLYYVYKMRTSDGGIVWTGTTTFSNMEISGLVVDSQGRIYLTTWTASSTGSAIYKYDPSIGTAPVATFSYPVSSNGYSYLAIDGSDNLYLSGGNFLKKLDTNGNQIWSVTPDYNYAGQMIATDGVNVYLGYDKYLGVFNAQTGALKQSLTNIPSGGYGADSFVSTDGYGSVYVHSADNSSASGPVTKLNLR